MPTRLLDSTPPPTATSKVATVGRRAGLWSAGRGERVLARLVRSLALTVGPLIVLVLAGAPVAHAGTQDERALAARYSPGVRLVELAESDLCCGSAGSYNLTEPAMAHALAARKVANIIATGADYVILSNPGCEFQIAAELRRQGSKARAIHLADFLAMAAKH